MAGSTRKGRRVTAGLFTCGLVLALAGTPAAARTDAINRPTPVITYVGPMQADGTCPPNEEFGGEDFHQLLLGVAWTDAGPTVLVLDLCYKFSGAIGGQFSSGTFWISTGRGRLEGHTTGYVAYGEQDRIHQTLTVERGTGRQARLTGTIDFDVAMPRSPAPPCQCYGGWLTPALQHSR